ncbi:2-isopropylmalate synthase [Rosenbergiella collisarenosi]|uniref:2-isopropylmalate synthase n=1 Tax=Rosenbergiella collisarenosi TaxID=1544695 RepID=UPI001F4F5FCC|nr:2-isopropylmalate synthase [Rosenbergiella collisarenosi]
MLLDPSAKYQPYPVIALADRTWPNKRLMQSPRWLSTDLRDGNQALAEPMNVERKVEFWTLLLDCGFKEIEVAFPAASETDFQFVRQLIDEKRIPDDVTIQVITQARPDLITRTFEALQGVQRATIHLYNATAPLFRRLVFQQSKEDIIKLAVAASQQIRQSCDATPGTHWTYQYSPETFCFTEPEFALEICQAVAEVWQPSSERPMIINLPSTVEVNTPNVYADQIEYFCRHFAYRERVCISVHPHNDQGCGVASAELALLAGAERVEGCLFGNGERTGNLCLVTLAMNLYSQGISPQLNFSELPGIVEQVEKFNQIPVHPRHPYAGKLAFTAFSGSHQDAIKKGFTAREQATSPLWEIPYLLIDPNDIGCDYEAVIRVNSQSGKSGTAWMLEQNHGLKLPRALQQAFSHHVQVITDQSGREMTLAQVWQLFRQLYGPYEQAVHQLVDYRTESVDDNRILFHAQVTTATKTILLEGMGNGLLSAAVNALTPYLTAVPIIEDYHEHTLGRQNESRSAAYILCTIGGKQSHWGVSIDSDIARACLQALLNSLPAAIWIGNSR